MSLDIANCSITDLPSIVTLLFERAGYALLPNFQGQAMFHIRYLRRKPERGLAVMYSIEMPSHTSSRKDTKHVHNRLVSLTVAEAALEERNVRFQVTDAQQALLSHLQMNVVQARDLGIAVQAFPGDNKLPTLAACCDTSHGSPLFHCLESTVHLQLGTSAWQLVSVDVQPIRYKPGSRCVLRYQLTLERTEVAICEQRELALYGKLYAHSEQASNVQGFMQTLYEEQLGEKQQFPMLPRSFAANSIPGLVLSEAVQPHGNGQLDNQVQTGNRLFQPRFQRRSRSEVILPTEELRLTANALACLHSSKIASRGMKVRTGKQEAQRAQERANLLVGYYPQQAERVQQLVQELARQLTAVESQQAIVHRIAHGGFKSSQLLFHSHQVFIIDFDGYCLADSALDIGYFLAYLRPSGLWYSRLGMREWFEAASSVFVQAYRQAMLEQGMDEQTLSAIIARSSLYEAALLFKIATRRVNRLNSPRPQELYAILNEIALCLSAKGETR